MLSKLENFIKKFYLPLEAPWKRKFLLYLSLFILSLSLLLSFSQFYFSWADFAAPILFSISFFFGILSFFGIISSLFGNDFWVALILGDF